MLSFIKRSGHFFQPSERVVALIRNPRSVIAFDLIQCFLRFAKSWRGFGEFQPTLGRKHSRICCTGRSLLPFENFCGVLGEFLGGRKLLLSDQKLSAPDRKST